MDLATLFGIGGPFVALAAVIGYTLNYLINRRKVNTESESGIVEATKATLHIVTANQEALATQLQTLRSENETLRQRLRSYEDDLDKAIDENKELRFRLDALEGRANGKRNGDTFS